MINTPDKTAHEHHHDDHGHDSKPHESPWVVTLPLILLAIPSIAAGYLVIAFLFGDFFDGVTFVDVQGHPAMQVLAEEFTSVMGMTMHAIWTAPFWLALAGVLAAWYCYLINPAVPAAVQRTLSPINKLLEEKYYMDKLWINVFAGGFMKLGKVFWKVGDQKIIDGTVVNGSWKMVGWLSGIVRKFQSGFIYYYALVMILGVFALMTYFVWRNY